MLSIMSVLAIGIGMMVLTMKIIGKRLVVGVVSLMLSLVSKQQYIVA